MFAESRFGTIRFGESPVEAVSPVLLSGVAVQGIADERVKINAERPVRSTNAGTSGSATIIQRAATISSGSREVPVSSGSAIGGSRALQSRVQSVGNASPDVEVLHILISSQHATSIAQIRVLPTTALTSAGTTASVASGTGVGIGRALAGIADQGSGVPSQALEVTQVLSSAQGTIPKGEVHILTTARLASGSVTITTSQLETSFPGLTVWIVQGSGSTVHPEIVRRPTSIAPTAFISIQTGLAVQTSLTSSARTLVWVEGSIRAPGLLIHNIQGIDVLGKLRTQRQTGSREIERSVSRKSHLKIVRTLSGSGVGTQSQLVRIIGKKIALFTLQEGISLGKMPTGRTLSGHSRIAANASNRVKIIREIGSIGDEEEIAILSPLLLRKVIAEEIQIGEGRTLLGRTRSINTVQQERFLFTGRFAVIPDLRNDRVIVIFAEGRRVVIPRQSEL